MTESGNKGIMILSQGSQKHSCYFYINIHVIDYFHYRTMTLGQRFLQTKIKSSLKDQVHAKHNGSESGRCGKPYKHRVQCVNLQTPLIFSALVSGACYRHIKSHISCDKCSCSHLYSPVTHILCSVLRHDNVSLSICNL